MQHFSTTDARKNLGKIVNKVKYEQTIVSLGRHNEQEALIIPMPIVEEDDLPITAINASSDSFDFLEDEPDLYSLGDLKKRYV